MMILIVARPSVPVVGNVKATSSPSESVMAAPVGNVNAALD